MEKARTPTSKAGKCNGLTFLELVVALFILSLLAAVVMPSFHLGGRSKAASDARRIASILRYLNDISILTKEPAHIKFDLSTGGISWESPEGNKSEVFKNLVAVGTPSKGNLREGQLTVFFTPSGVEEDITVYLMSETGEIRIMLSSVSGRVKISNPQPEASANVVRGGEACLKVFKCDEIPYSLKMADVHMNRHPDIDFSGVV